MERLKNIWKNKWAWGAGITAVFAVIFFLAFSAGTGQDIHAAGDAVIYDREGNTVDGEYTMRSARATLQVLGLSDVKSYTWSVPNDGDPTVELDSDTVNTREVTMTAMKNGKVAVTLHVEFNDTEQAALDIVTQVEVVFSISEYLDPDSTSIRDNTELPSGVKMTKITSEDERYALVMDPDGSVYLGSDGSTQDGNINLTFGDAWEAQWESSNTDVFSINSTTREIRAMGVGRATLTVTETIGTDTYTDSIYVYVRPEITVYDTSGSEVTADSSGSYSITTGSYISLNGKFSANPLEGIGQKVHWVIANEDSSGNVVLVSDSDGNTGTGGSDTYLEWSESKQQYRVTAKAGSYRILFYVYGTYSSFDEVQAQQPGCAPASITAEVQCSFTDKEVTLSLGGYYSLANAFNISLDVLTKSGEFSIECVDSDGNTTSAVYTDLSEWVISASKGLVGTDLYRVKHLDTATVKIPGMSVDEVTVKVTTGNTFTLNASDVTMVTGDTLDLSGVLGSGNFPDGSTYEWSISSTDSSYIEIVKQESMTATISAKKSTPTNSRATVTLYWTNTEGVTQSASCKITVTDSATSIVLSKTSLTLATGESEYITTTVPTGNQNLVWVSSNEDIVTVDVQAGNTAANIIAGTTVGTAIITVLNPDNNVCTTLTVTVSQEMTSLSIDLGTTYEVDLARSFLQMNAEYEPSNATSTEVQWTSSDRTVAEIDQDGTITLLSSGTTVITVSSTNNPTPLNATCTLTVVTTKIETIALTETELNLIKGETYTLDPVITPENPADKTMTWQSADTKVATVEDGVVTAVAVGSTVITVYGGYADPVTVIVNVRDKLQSIAFAETRKDITVGQTSQLNVVFDPSENVNTTLSFRSTDETIVKVDENGLITGVSEGFAMITCIAEDLGAEGAITCMVYVTAAPVTLTGLSVDPTEATIKVTETVTITPKLTPENATNQSITYQSTDTSVATVTEEGVVTGVSAGVAVIQVVATDTSSGTSITAVCTVTVLEAVEFSLSPSSREIAVGKSFKIKKVVSPSTAKKAATWKSSNTKVATVNSSGKVTGKKIGSCTITCTLTTYNQKAKCRVKVAKLKTSLKLDKKSIRLNVGQTYTLKKTISTNNSKNPSVKFSSKNSKIASVGSKSGRVKGKSVGSTIITAKTTDSVHATAKCRVTVIRRAKRVVLNKTYATCYVGGTLKLRATVKPDNTTIQKVKWKSSDSKVAAVVSSGKVTGIAEGEVTITATTTDGSNKSATCVVKVLESISASSITVSQSDLTMKKGDKAKLSYTVLPSNTSDSIKMASDNERVAKVTNSGKVTAVGTGTATITITSTSGVTATVAVNVVALNKTSIRMRQYDTETLTMMGTSDTVTWYSANNRIATVSNGKITGKGIGVTYIYATVNGCKVSCKVRIVSVNTKKR
ncbi:MAG: Ig-like domain-containing protein [Clostridiaceae bacterium]|nr:Ig-like domain-containing protein [Clostridiaceae bacterium]